MFILILFCLSKKTIIRPSTPLGYKSSSTSNLNNTNTSLSTGGTISTVNTPQSKQTSSFNALAAATIQPSVLTYTLPPSPVSINKIIPTTNTAATTTGYKLNRINNHQLCKYSDSSTVTAEVLSSISNKIKISSNTVSMNYENQCSDSDYVGCQENLAPSRISTGSDRHSTMSSVSASEYDDCTIYTSVTQVKERSSSITMIKDYSNKNNLTMSEIM
jgi:hypothetical protein